MFFAVSGEFPTSGALSRLPNDVPLAGPWVVNRAMTGMEQRYANARAMLTDVDYIFWAASTGNLEQVKPADLPSFKGMPVPPHLAATPQNNTEWRERMAAAPGGYGAWYAAPMYQRKRKSGFRKVAAGLLIFSVVSATLLGAAMMFVGVHQAQRHASVEHPEARRPLVELLPREQQDLAPWFAAIDESMRQWPQGRGGQSTQVDVQPPGKLAQTLARNLEDAQSDILKNFNQLWRKRGIRDVREIEIVLVWNTDQRQSLERELILEAASRGLSRIRPATEREAGALLQIAGGPEARPSAHELGEWFARQGMKPAMVVVLETEHLGGMAPSTLRAGSYYPNVSHWWSGRLETGK
jgi:hypothetical protein